MSLATRPSSRSRTTGLPRPGLPRARREEIYGQYVFHEAAQRQFLAKPIFRRLRRTIEGLEPSTR